MGYKLKRILVHPGGVEKQVRPSAMPAGIYHNATLGLISLSSDGSNWLTTADKNLGATVVFNGTEDDSNCGKQFQRGNNYMFNYGSNPTSGSQTFNASTYGPQNYYSSDYFCTNSSYWDTSHNQNLWGDVTDTLEARQGPCDTGYHIPSQPEIQSVYNIGISLGAWGVQGSNDMRQYLLLPYNGFNPYKPVGSFRGQFGFYWTSTADGTASKFLQFQNAAEDIHYNQSGATTIAMAIRPFKNEAVQPDSNRTVLYQPS